MVHISKATLLHLNGEFEVVAGNGGLRDDYLLKHEVETFFIVPPKSAVSSTNQIGHKTDI